METRDEAIQRIRLENERRSQESERLKRQIEQLESELDQSITIWDLLEPLLYFWSWYYNGTD
jgi:hypothetical protein